MVQPALSQLHADAVPAHPLAAGRAQTPEVLAQIYHSSRQSISSYADLHKARKINYAWITLHAVYLVGLSYVYALRTHFQNKRRQLQSLADGLPSAFQAQLTPDPTISQIVSDTRACSTVLVALSEGGTRAEDATKFSRGIPTPCWPRHPNFT